MTLDVDANPTWPSCAVWSEVCDIVSMAQVKDCSHGPIPMWPLPSSLLHHG